MKKNSVIVHPTHIPLERKTKASHHAGCDTPPQAVDSSAIVHAPGASSAFATSNPRKNSMASRFSRPPYGLGSHSPERETVVQIEHRCDGVHAQPVHMKLAQPVQRIGRQKAANFRSSLKRFYCQRGVVQIRPAGRGRSPVRWTTRAGATRRHC